MYADCQVLRPSLFMSMRHVHAQLSSNTALCSELCPENNCPVQRCPRASGGYLQHRMQERHAHSAMQQSASTRPCTQDCRLQGTAPTEQQCRVRHTQSTNRVGNAHVTETAFAAAHPCMQYSHMPSPGWVLPWCQWCSSNAHPVLSQLL